MTSSSVVYLLDTNVFIEASRRYYAFDVAPSFWDQLAHRAASNEVRSIDRVQRELERGRDDLATWATTVFAAWFLPTDTSIDSYSDVMEWVILQNQFTDAAKTQFAEVADGWLVAYAIQHGCLVVTQEVISQDVKRRVPIPNVCSAFGVQYIDTFQMLRELGVRL